MRFTTNMWWNTLWPQQHFQSRLELLGHHERQMLIDGISEWVIWAKRR